MKTNTSITIFHKYFDEATTIDKWKRQVVKNVMLQGGKGASLNKGYDNANDIDIYIPLNKNDISTLEIDIGDIITLGHYPRDINKQSDISFITFNITSIEDNRYGSLNTQHIYIGAK